MVSVSDFAVLRVTFEMADIYIICNSGLFSHSLSYGFIQHLKIRMNLQKSFAQINLIDSVTDSKWLKINAVNLNFSSAFSTSEFTTAPSG